RVATSAWRFTRKFFGPSAEQPTALPPPLFICHSICFSDGSIPTPYRPPVVSSPRVLAEASTNPPSRHRVPPAPVTPSLVIACSIRSIHEFVVEEIPETRA